MSLKIDRVQLEIVINNDQARKQMRELDEEARKLTSEMKKLDKTSAEYAQKAARLKSIKTQMDGIYESIGVANLTMRELANRQRDLNAIIQNVRPGTEEYRRLRNELDQINARMGELRGRSRETGMSLRGVADGFNRYFGMATAFLASFTGIVLGFRKLVDMANAYGESVANLSALTGLAGRELNWLSNQAKEVAKNGTDAGIKVTAGAQAIVDAYTLMGSAKPELLQNKEALDQVTQSALIMADAAKIKATEAVDSLANTMNQFSAPASEATRYINVLAAGSKAGAAAIPSISASMVKFGAAADVANISVEESVALIETLAEKGLKGELAGTQIKTALLKMQTGADDTNPKIVGLSTALENLKNKNMSAADMVKFFGQEAYIAGQILISNVDRVNYFTEAVTGTNVALEQARINTDSDAAAKQRAVNRYELTAIKLGERLAPAVTFSTNAFTYLLKAIVSSIDLFNIMTGGVESATDAFDAQVSKVADLHSNISPLLSRYDELSVKTVKSKEEHEEMKSIIEQVAETIPSAITQFDKYGNAVSISTSRVRDFITAETDRLKVVNDKAIKENQRKLNLIIQQEELSRNRLDEIAQKGYFNIYENTSTGTTVIQTVRKATEEEIKAEQDKFKSLLSQRNGYEAEIKRLNGDALTEELDRREKERKAAQELELKRIEYRKKSKSELEKLDREGDALAKEMLLAFNIEGGGGNGEPLATQYERLGKKISEAKNKLQDLLLTGNMEEALKVGEVVTHLETTKKLLDDIVAAGGDLGKVIDNLRLEQIEKAFSGKTALDTDKLIADDLSFIDSMLNQGTNPNLNPIKHKIALDKDFYLQSAQIATDAAFQIFKNNADAKLDYEMYILNQSMERELKNKNLTEEQKEKIRDKYEAKERKLRADAWKRQRNADFIQSLILGSLATLRALAAPPGWPLNAASVITAGGMAAAQSGFIIAQKVPQFARGRYNVIGADDNRLYNAAYTGAAQTKIYTTPSLVAEQGSELIVDAKTTRNLMMNYPGIIEAIYAARVPQRATGNLNTVQLPAGDPELRQAIERLNNNLEKGIRGKWVLYDLEKAQDKLLDIRNESTF